MSTRILVIEDNPTNLYLMNYLLQSFGYAVLTASDGREGLETAGRELPDMIICDIQMPVMDGYEFVRLIRDNPRLTHIPIVAITAFAMVDDRQKVLASGFDNYLSKPIDPEVFEEQIRGFLNNAHKHNTG
jgi:CheY-like chemotaxis protein